LRNAHQKNETVAAKRRVCAFPLDRRMGSMTNRKTPKIVISRNGVINMGELSMIALDLADAEAAFAVAKRIAEQTGRTVTVRDADGKVLDTFRRAATN
jgi:hypothetical protein